MRKFLCGQECSREREFPRVNDGRRPNGGRGRGADGDQMKVIGIAAAMPAGLVDDTSTPSD
jgi:hypothetical protein